MKWLITNINENQLEVLPDTAKKYHQAQDIVQYLSGLKPIQKRGSHGWVFPAYKCNLDYLAKRGIKVSNIRPVEKPKTRIVVSTGIRISYPTPDIIKKAIALSVIKNPQYADALRFGRSIRGIPPTIEYYQQGENYIIIPRGAYASIHKKIEGAKVYDRRHGHKIKKPIAFKGELRPRQKEALDQILSNTTGFGFVVLPTGAGKTILALAMIYHIAHQTLIVVHTKELLEQWAERVKSFMGFSPGVIGAGKTTIKAVTIGMVQTLRNRKEEIKNQFGHVVVDECHRTPASTFFDLLTAVNAKYVHGLTATDFRSDGLTDIIPLALGDCLYQASNKELQDDGHVLRPIIINIETAFYTNPKPTFLKGKRKTYNTYSQIVKALIEDKERNDLVAKTIDANANKMSCVLSDRIEHLHTLAALITTKEKEILTGSLKDEERKQIVEKINKGKVKVIFATTQLIGEGFDAALLEHIHLPYPVKFQGRVIQIVGRALRPSKGKQPKVFNYIDIRQPALVNQARERARAFAKLNAIEKGE